MIENRIEDILIAKKMSKKELADKMNVEPASIQNYLRGNPTINTIKAIADALEVEIGDLFPVKDGYKRFETVIGDAKPAQSEHQTLFCPHCGQKFVMLPRED